MSASPELYRPAEAPAFSPSCATQPPLPLVFAGDDYCCRTPTGSGICYLREPTTCPPAPRKPPPPPPMCRKRLFQAADQQLAEAGPVPVISIRLDELERLFRPCPPPTTTTTDKRRRSGSGPSPRSATKHGAQLQLRSMN
jgi:hypothetical protein